jgi:hypothetical protein
MTNKKKQTKAHNPMLEPELPPKFEPEFEPEYKSWTLSVGIYPGILFGIRTYEEVTFKTHVLYLPFIDIALEIDN